MIGDRFEVLAEKLDGTLYIFVQLFGWPKYA